MPYPTAGDMQLMPGPGQAPGLGGIGGALSKLFGGIGNLTAPYGGAQQQMIDPAFQKQLQSQAMLQLGLGMMAAKERGAGLGQAAFQGLGAASSNYQDAMNQAYRNALGAKEDARQDKANTRADTALEREDQWRKDQAAQQDRQFGESLKLKQRELDAIQKQADAGLAVDQEKLSQMQQNFARMSELNAIGWANLTPSQQSELNILAGSTPAAREAASYRDPRLMLEGFGGAGGGQQQGGRLSGMP